jgi:hypothetical protein
MIVLGNVQMGSAAIEMDEMSRRKHAAVRRSSQGRDDGRRVFKKDSTAKEAFLGKARLQRAVHQPCSAI